MRRVESGPVRHHAALTSHRHGPLLPGRIGEAGQDSGASSPFKLLATNTAGRRSHTNRSCSSKANQSSLPSAIICYNYCPSCLESVSKEGFRGCLSPGRATRYCHGRATLPDSMVRSSSVLARRDGRGGTTRGPVRTSAAPS